MSIRKMLPLMMVAVALLAASAAFAAEPQPVPMTQEQFLSALQAPAAPADTNETAIFHPVGSTPAPEMKHGTNCSYFFTCRTCTGGYEACDVYTCSYNGGTHKHWYCSGVCSNPCAI